MSLSRTIGSFLVATTCLGLGLTSTVFAQDSERGEAILVLDASGSMWGQIGGIAKMDLARKAVEGMLEEWDPSLELGLMAYGHRRDGDCSDIELLRAPQALDRPSFVASIGELRPKGKTPLTEAVVQAAEILRSKTQRATVILVSDGKETCNLDPCAVGRQLEEEGVDFTAHVIGFDVPSEDTHGLKCLAERTGGMYLEASNTEELTQALSVATEVAGASPEDLLLGPATIVTPDSVAIGAIFLAQWTGPKNPSDRLSMRRSETMELVTGTPLGSASVGPSVELRAPLQPGNYMVFYEVGRGHTPLAKAPITVVDVVASIAIEPLPSAGSNVAVDWTGPGNPGDRLIIRPADGGEALTTTTARESDARPTQIRVPDESGSYRILLVDADGSELASAAFSTVPVQASVSVPSQVFTLGKSILVEWSGPKNHGDRLAVYPLGSDKRLSQRSASGSAKSPVKVRLGATAGTYRIQLETASGTVLAETEVDFK